MAKILLVEDDPAIAKRVEQWLVFEKHIVESVDNGIEASERLRLYSYELVILDWNLPGMEGPDVCRKFRAQGGKIPILFLTGQGAITDKELGFQSGADDYLTKPFDVRELSMRVKALLRRPQSMVTAELHVGNVCVNTETHSITVDGEPVHLPPREFLVLQFLMRHPGQVFSAEALVNRVWSSETDVVASSIRPCITKIRSKIERDGKCILQTVHGVGYKIEPGDC